VNSRQPLWTAAPDQPVVRGLRSDRPEILCTNTLDAEPEHREELPGPSIWPLWLAIAISFGFIASIFTPWGVVWGLVAITPPLIGWYWSFAKKHHLPLQVEEVR
jgi:cytochrome c oxidase subunit 1